SLPDLTDRVKINTLHRLTSDDTLHLIGDKTDYDQVPILFHDKPEHKRDRLMIKNFYDRAPSRVQKELEKKIDLFTTITELAAFCHDLEETIHNQSKLIQAELRGHTPPIAIDETEKLKPIKHVTSVSDQQQHQPNPLAEIEGYRQFQPKSWRDQIAHPLSKNQQCQRQFLLDIIDHLQHKKPNFLRNITQHEPMKSKPKSKIGQEWPCSTLEKPHWLWDVWPGMHQCLPEACVVRGMDEIWEITIEPTIMNPTSQQFPLVIMNSTNNAIKVQKANNAIRFCDLIEEHKA
uniref:Uncharacterized protein n=1 Tax=Romanomermis culicivorax TaxID=13658 RepID=A0A915I336_ROMCU